VKKFVRGERPVGRRIGKVTVAMATASLLVSMAACSGGGSDETSGTKSADSEAVVTEAMKPVTTVEMPTKAFTPPQGKRILIMPCGSAGQGCVNEAKVEKQVAESLGWTVDVVDGKLDPTTWNQVVKQAADSGVDGIIAVSADPNLYTDAMAQVKAKNIPFVLTQQPPRDGDVEGVSAHVAPDPAPGGKDVAEWIKADSGGKGHVLVLDLPGFAAVQARAKSLIDTLQSDCADCKTTKVDVSVQTMGTSLAPLVTSQLQQHPDISYVWGSDDCCVSFVQQGIQLAGKTSSVKLLSMSGYPDQMKQIKTGELSAELATATPFSGWLAVDTLARLMAGESLESDFWPAPQRIFSPVNIDDAPSSVFEVGWDVDTDYESEFKKMWGMK
jgi:ABC-type sugar transport system substrate-binding protein